MAVKFIFNEIFIKVPDRKRLKGFIIDMFIREGKSLFELNYIFCTDTYLLAINNEFLGHDEFTDIITFRLSEPPDPIVGEIYISADRIKDNAKILSITVDKELHRVIFHGALHLCGYNDKTPAHKRKMTTAENLYLKRYFV